MPNYKHVEWRATFQQYNNLTDEQRNELKKWLKWDNLRKVWRGDVIRPYNEFLEKKLFFVREIDDSERSEKVASIFGKVIKENRESYEKLRKYQQQTINKAIKHLFIKDFDNYIISFSTGLGKTPTSIFIADVGRRLLYTKVLVVVPAALQYQWYEEIRKWLKNDFVGVVKEKKDLVYGRNAYAIISYEKVRNWYQKHPGLFSDYKVVILDEASKLKNSNTKTYHVFKEFLKGRKSILLTATPIENGLLDLHNLLVVSGGYYFSKKKELEKYFIKDYVYNPHLGYEVEVIVGYQNLDEYRKYVEGKIVRASRKDVLDELPKVSYQWLEVKLTKEQIKFLWEFLEGNEEKLKEGDIFSLWTNLKTIVNGFYNAQNPQYFKCEKFNVVEELVEEILNENESVVILTQYETIAKQLFNLLASKHWGKVFLVSGSTTNKQDIINQWKQVGGILIGTTTIARGFNLENANYMVVYNIPENPAELQQWIGRIVRMTSNEPKTIYFLVSEVLEKRVVNLLNIKQNVSNEVLGEGVYEYEVERLGRDELWEIISEIKESLKDL